MTIRSSMLSSGSVTILLPSDPLNLEGAQIINLDSFPDNLNLWVTSHCLHQVAYIYITVYNLMHCLCPCHSLGLVSFCISSMAASTYEDGSLSLPNLPEHWNFGGETHLIQLRDPLCQDWLELLWVITFNERPCSRLGFDLSARRG